MIDNTRFNSRFLQILVWFPSISQQSWLETTYESGLAHGLTGRQYYPWFYSNWESFRLRRFLRRTHSGKWNWPKTSTRRLSNELNVNATSPQACPVKLKPWKSDKFKFLSSDHHQWRIECCQAILEKYSYLPRRQCYSIQTNVRFMRVTKCLSVFWCKNHHHFKEHVKHHPLTVMVWAPMCAEHLVGLHSIDGREIYRSF